ncbi:MAG TPA: hypothetical protein VJ183_03695 [Chloroflexia bacterium]|nr:hypothetical protein [Chloroflexia bacterium]
MTLIRRGKDLKEKVRYIALVSTLGIVAVMGLAACGDATSSNIQPTSAVGGPTATIVALEVQPTATMSSEMPGMSGDTMTETPTTSVSNPEVTPTQPSTGQVAGSTTEVAATLREWSIELSQAEVPAGTIRFTVTNESRMQHNLTILDGSGEIAGTPDFSSRQGAQTLEVNLQPGTYTLICSLPGHAARGQRTTLVVK